MGMQAKKIEPERLERQQGMAQAVFERIQDKNKTYYIETYGCQMNVRDSETIAGLLQGMGYSPSETKEKADVILFNTCCVRDHAEKRLLANIGALKERKEEDQELIIGICGCMMQQADVSRKVMRRFPFVNFVFGTNVLWRLPELMLGALDGERLILTEEEGFAVCEGLPAHRSNPFSAFVNITFGCDNFCSYCIVPYVRGRERSRELSEVVDEVRSLADRGITEITLLGQNVNSYGKGTGVDFADLLHAVNAVDGIRRIRYMSSHPKDLSPRLMAAIAQNDKVCHHMHLPVQSGSTAILERMNRRYTREGYLQLVEDLRRTVPDIELTTDVIVGFPGETDRDFEDTLSLMDEVGYAAAFTFKYSPRKGTRAAEMEDQIPEAIKKERLKALNELQAKKTAENNQKYLGHRGEVLVEGFDRRQETILFGKLDTFKMVYFPGDEGLLGTYQTVQVTECARNSLLGRME
ncbi:MAG: tRNA (N6-isopentenyl adenosine(37)-C2)-methylthiotransferase MiaB [Clostridia bacterium]|nr:tRNA (N6-isopentenyl adenosine(37)-C2)-methylthiotransferase MiaB [Clostridia bacterium]